MWVKGTLLHFIVESVSQKNIISVEVIKWLALPTTPHPQPYTIEWVHQGSDLHVSQQFQISYAIKTFKDEVLCDVSPLKVCEFFWSNLIYGNIMLYMILGLVVLLLL
jgi:hypothetical protein